MFRGLQSDAPVRDDFSINGNFEIEPMEYEVGRLASIVEDEAGLQLLIDAYRALEGEFLPDVECGGGQGHDGGHFRHGEGEQQCGRDEAFIEVTSDCLPVASDIVSGRSDAEGGQYFAFNDLKEHNEWLSLVHGSSVRCLVPGTGGVPIGWVTAGLHANDGRSIHVAAASRSVVADRGGVTEPRLQSDGFAVQLCAERDYAAC